MRIEFIIMAHPKRKDLVNNLFLTLSKYTDNVAIVWDKKNNEWDTGRRCLELADPEFDWTVIIQDDAVICEDFGRAINSCLSISDNPVSLYFGKHEKTIKIMSKIFEDAKGYDFIALRELLHGVAICLPSKDCKKIALEDNNLLYDKKISEFYKKRKIYFLYTNPSLVEHKEEKSLLSHDMGERKAFLFGNKTDFKNKIYTKVI